MLLQILAVHHIVTVVAFVVLHGSPQFSCCCCRKLIRLEKKRSPNMTSRCQQRPTILLLLKLLLVLLQFLLRSDAQQEQYAFCGDCFCINGDEDCPTTVPATTFTAEYISFLKSLQPTNPYELNCNPYQDETCETTPSQSNLTALGDAAVCGIIYETVRVENEQCPTEYTMESFASLQDLETAGAVLTHHGACGVCSTTQDLAVYIENVDLVEKGTECSIQGIISFQLGVRY